MPPTRATGNIPRCSQPRSRGLTAATRSATAVLPIGSRGRVVPCGQCTYAHRRLRRAGSLTRRLAQRHTPSGRQRTRGNVGTGGHARAARSTADDARTTRRPVGWRRSWSTAHTSAECSRISPGVAPAARRRHARRQPAVGPRARRRHGARPPGRRRQDRGPARVVRGGRRRVRHPVAALDRQPAPRRGGELGPLLKIIETAVADLADSRSLAAADRRRPRPAARRRPRTSLQRSAAAHRGRRRA